MNDLADDIDMLVGFEWKDHWPDRCGSSCRGCGWDATNGTELYFLRFVNICFASPLPLSCLLMYTCLAFRLWQEREWDLSP